MTIRSKIRMGLAALVASVAFPLFARAGTTIEKYSTEITHAEDGNVLKVSPFDYTLPSETQQSSLMIGKKFGDLTVYGFWKSDSKDRSWVGLRTDYSMKGLEGKLRSNIQFRWFKGMNKASSDEFYFVPSIGYSVGKFSFGAIGYAKQASGSDPCFFVGPSVNMKLTDSINLFVSYDWDMLSDNNMVFAKTGFRF